MCITADGSSIFPDETGEKGPCLPTALYSAHSGQPLFICLTNSYARDWGCKTQNLPSDHHTPMLKSLTLKVTSQFLTMASRAPQNVASPTSDHILPTYPCFPSSSGLAGLLAGPQTLRASLASGPLHSLFLLPVVLLPAIHRGFLPQAASIFSSEAVPDPSWRTTAFTPSHTHRHAFPFPATFAFVALSLPNGAKCLPLLRSVLPVFIRLSS